MATNDSTTKLCARCKVEKPLVDFYFRQGNPHSYCKACIKDTAAAHRPKDRQVPKDETEIIAAKYLESWGIPVLPGKALQYSHVDIIAFGCIRIEVKFSSLIPHSNHFKWTFSPRQSEQGVLAELIMLVCNYKTYHTFHLFPVTFPAFYINGKMKTGLTFTPGAMAARKFGKTRVVMTQPMMDIAQNRVNLIHDLLGSYCEGLKAKHALQKVA